MTSSTQQRQGKCVHRTSCICVTHSENWAVHNLVRFPNPLYPVVSWRIWLCITLIQCDTGTQGLSSEQVCAVHQTSCSQHNQLLPSFLRHVSMIRKYPYFLSTRVQFHWNLQTQTLLFIEGATSVKSHHHNTKEYVNSCLGLRKICLYHSLQTASCHSSKWDQMRREWNSAFTNCYLTSVASSHSKVEGQLLSLWSKCICTCIQWYSTADTVNWAQNAWFSYKIIFQK